MISKHWNYSNFPGGTPLAIDSIGLRPSRAMSSNALGSLVFRNKTIRNTIALMALTCAAGYALGMLGILPATGGVVYQDVQAVVAPAEVGSTTWRYTKNGWEDIGGMYPDSFVPLQSFELVHPLVWAASVLFAVIGTSIWASNEWEIARLIQRSQKSVEDHRP